MYGNLWYVLRDDLQVTSEERRRVRNGSDERWTLRASRKMPRSSELNMARALSEDPIAAAFITDADRTGELGCEDERELIPGEGAGLFCSCR